MKKEQARQHIEQLIRDIQHHNELYYNQSRPEIADVEYDALMFQLKSFETQYPDLVMSDSPTQKVGAPLSLDMSLHQPTVKVKHRVKMLSLDNTYSLDELRKWDERVRKGLKGQSVEYVVELKIDGVSASLVFEQDRLMLGATRGDGTTGEDVTRNIRLISELPQQLDVKNPPQVFDVRGEVYMTHDDFQRMNRQRMKDGEQAFANPRNATSGSLKLLDAETAQKRKLHIFVHSFGYVKADTDFLTQWDFLAFCRKAGLPVNSHNRLCRSLDEVVDFCEEFQEKRFDLGYDCDGVVVKVNRIQQQKDLGETMKSPRWAVAYKFPAQQTTTRVIRIDVQVGRTGVLTPVAKLEPVQCAGVMISSATLHNFDQIKKLGVQIGDRVLIERAGDVIPKIVSVVEKEKGVKGHFRIPSKCPVCRGKVMKMAMDQVAYRCMNPSCPRQLERGLLHFASRGAMDIDGLGEAVVHQLLEKRRLKDLADIYTLTQKDLLDLELFKEKRAGNLLEGIEKSKEQPLSRLIFALGIPNIGEKASLILARRFKTINKLMKADRQALSDIRDFGVIMADSFRTFFDQRASQNLIEKFKRYGVNMVEPIEVISGPLEGKRFVFTGELPGIPRRQAKALVMRMGGEVLSSISQNVDYLVAGISPGSKCDKARELGITIINAETFREMVHA